jgi:hypothetical protein
MLQSAKQVETLSEVRALMYVLHHNAVGAVHRYLFVFLSQQRRKHCAPLLREGEFSSGVTLVLREFH